jgi:hypothetical protein
MKGPCENRNCTYVRLVLWRVEIAGVVECCLKISIIYTYSAHLYCVIVDCSIIVRMSTPARGFSQTTNQVFNRLVTKHSLIPVWTGISRTKDHHTGLDSAVVMDRTDP